MLELAMLESSLSSKPVDEKEKEEGVEKKNTLTEAEESTLDTIMQGLGIDSESENEENADLDIDLDLDLDLDAMGIQSDDDNNDEMQLDINVDEIETHDFSAEFGL